MSHYATVLSPSLFESGTNIHTYIHVDINEIHFDFLILKPQGPSAKKRKLDDASSSPSSSSSPDDDIYWRMNEDRFELLFRDRLLVKGVENRLDRTASEVFRSMLRLNELSSDATSESSALLSSVEGTRNNLCGMDVVAYLLKYYFLH